MSRLELFSEPFAKTGNMAAEGFRRLLGRPSLGLLQTFLRESIQNVIDASLDSVGPKVTIRVRTLTSAQRRALGESILGDRPVDTAARKYLDTSLGKPSLRVIEICDEGTEGLSGPTRADAPHDDEEPLNFVNFLRNVGAARDTSQGGGTYGYGKSSLYALSACTTILVDSQTLDGGRPVRRLMGCHMGAAFDAKSGRTRRRFTGRHWWGVTDADGIEPATGALARDLSERVGMLPRSKSDTGTSIMVVDPLLGSRDLAKIAEDIIETVLWNFWPRMTATTPRKRKLRVRVEIDDRQIPVPKPEDFPPLDLFASAIRMQREGEGDVRSIECLRPIRTLGKLSFAQGLRAERKFVADPEDPYIPQQCSHVALMRPVELVVKYVEGVPYPDRRFEWAGVFICSDEEDVESAFASAEPPAHDDWMPKNMPKSWGKTFVTVALREINAAANSFASPAVSDQGVAGRGPSLAATAAKMGSLLDRVSSRGPGRPIRKPSRPTSRKSLSISSARFAGLHLGPDGTSFAKFVAELQNDGSEKNLCLHAEPHFVVDGGATGLDDLPASYRLRVASIAMPEFDLNREDSSLEVGTRSGTVECIVATVPGAAVGLKINLSSGKTK